jgi:hypothetical protein
MYVDARFVTGLATMVCGAGVIIIAQKNEINRLKQESKDKSFAIGVYRRAFETALSDATHRTVMQVIADMDEEAKFYDIIKKI